jgi:hypothetical protein
MPASSVIAAVESSPSSSVTESRAPPIAPRSVTWFHPAFAPVVSSVVCELTRVVTIGTVAVSVSRLERPSAKEKGNRLMSPSSRVRNAPASNRNVESPESDRTASSAALSVGKKNVPRLSVLRYAPSGIFWPVASNSWSKLAYDGAKLTRSAPRGTRYGSGSWAAAAPAHTAVRAATRARLRRVGGGMDPANLTARRAAREPSTRGGGRVSPAAPVRAARSATEWPECWCRTLR